MLERLRKMSPEAKRKVVMFCAGILTFIILALWAAYSFGGFSLAFEKTREQGVAVFSFLDQNVEKAYNAFKENMPSFSASSTEETASTMATTTESISTTTPTN